MEYMWAAESALPPPCNNAGLSPEGVHGFCRVVGPLDPTQPVTQFLQEAIV